jgi:hypothetical protein
LLSGWPVGSGFFFVFSFFLSVAAAWSASPTVRCGSSAVYQLSCFGVGLSLCLFTRVLCLCLAPFPWSKGKVSDLAASCHCHHVVMVCCLFLNTAEPSDCVCPGTEYYSLLPSLLPYFKQWPITCCCRPSCHLFTDGPH